jgi:hypothetical protein
MGEVIKALRAAVLDAAAVEYGASPATALTGTDAVELGTVTDAVNENLRVYRTPNGSALIFGDQGTALGFDPAGLGDLRKLLDLCAMPDREGGDAHPDEDDDGCPGCRPGGRDDEHVPGCDFGPEAYKSHRPGCECWDCKAARKDGEAVDGEGSDLD